MKLGLLLGLAATDFRIDIEAIREAEALGYDSVWSSEAYGSDAVSPAAWVLAGTSKIRVGTAIMQMPARTPATAAGTAMTLNALSGGRFLLGLGPSGPQVVEGWHGMPYAHSLDRMREYIAIVRMILKREGPAEFRGDHYRLPYDGPGATGLGKPLKSMIHGDPALPIYTAAITPAGLRLAAELADGVFPIFIDPGRRDVLSESLNRGFAAGGRDPAGFDLAPFVWVSMGADIAECRAPIKRDMALYIGGMGARSKNFYNDYAKRMGFVDEAAEIQNLFLGGQRAAAAAAVPDALVDATSLVGPREHIVEQLRAWKAAGERGDVNTMLLRGASREAVRVIAAEML